MPVVACCLHSCLRLLSHPWPCLPAVAVIAILVLVVRHSVVPFLCLQSQCPLTGDGDLQPHPSGERRVLAEGGTWIPRPTAWFSMSFPANFSIAIPHHSPLSCLWLSVLGMAWILFGFQAVARLILDEGDRLMDEGFEEERQRFLEFNPISTRVGFLTNVCVTWRFHFYLPMLAIRYSLELWALSETGNSCGQPCSPSIGLGLGFVAGLPPCLFPREGCCWGG